MSLEKDIRDLTAAINNLASAMREGRVTVSEGAPEPLSERDAWYASPPGTPAPLSVREPYDVKAVSKKLAEPEVIPTPHGPVAVAPEPLTFEQVKQVFLDIARGAPDPMEGSKRSRAVLAKYGASKLKDVEEAKWPAFVEDCRAAAAVVA